MLAVPTTTVTVLRGTGTNGFGDVTDSSVVIATGVPASLVEQRQNSTQPVSRAPRTVRYAKCRLPSSTPVQSGDRIKDESTGVVWQLDDTTQLRNVAATPDLRLNLRRAT